MAAFDVILGDTHCILDLGDHRAFLRLTGHWGGENAVKLSRFFTKALNGLQDKLILSLEGCRSMDAQAVSVLLRLQEQLEAIGKRVVLVGVPSALRTLFEGTALNPHAEASSASAILELR
jgi:anti-anti-sigma factor